MVPNDICELNLTDLSWLIAARELIVRGGSKRSTHTP